MSKLFLTQAMSSSHRSLKGESIRACDLPKQNIEPSFKNQIVSQKKYCIRNIVADTITSCIFLGLIAFFISVLCKAEEVNTNAITAIFATIIFATVTVIMGKRLVNIPKRISNYKNYNFERTCYATVSSKYKRTTSSKSGRSSIYYVNLQINDNQHIKNIVVNWSKYVELQEGDTVIAVSFDGYSTQIIKARSYSNTNDESFSRENVYKGSTSAKDILMDIKNDNFDMENFD